MIGKPKGLVQDQLKAVGLERFGNAGVDRAKRRSRWMRCDCFGDVIIVPINIEHTAGALRVMAQQVADACNSAGLTDSLVAAERTGGYPKSIFRALRQAGFDTRIVDPFCVPSLSTSVAQRC